MTFGNILKKLRQDNNLTQDELAKKIDTSRSNIANYENGKNMPSVDILEKLAKLFDCTTDYLLGKSDIRNPEKAQEDPLGLAKIGFSMKDYNPPTNKQREQLAELIKVVLKDNKKEDKEKNENNKG